MMRRLLSSIVFAGVAVVIVKSLPDISRYLKMRQM
jgi:hypothetical protein